MELLLVESNPVFLKISPKSFFDSGFDPGAEASEKKMPPSGRTQEKMKRIRDYFWRYPDGSPETCLLTLEPENGPENQNDAVPEKE